MPEEFKNAAGLISPVRSTCTLIRQENGAFRHRSSNRGGIRKRALRFSVSRKYLKNGTFWKRWPQDNHVTSLPDVFFKHKSTMTGDYWDGVHPPSCQVYSVLTCMWSSSGTGLTLGWKLNKPVGPTPSHWETSCEKTCKFINTKHNISILY